ncbi:MAG TPA: Asp-tRNA(Asn)/Glu-tRNA(Gln) amidotransferase subunit GatA [Candidatus Dormibacteraeota bacterium]|nr:Asp-tRNA(Asn)/Glu-tRNA(Gln) amidotransferase subunit GatA [Candidatus Dormibacteraeota bacterium]
MSLLARPIAELARGLRSRDFSSVELLESALAEVAREDGELGAFLRTTAGPALVQAQRADRLLSDDPASASPLLGIPVAYKDVLCTKGVETTAGSRILEGFIPPFSATAVERMEAAGAVSLGKLNCDEFAMGSSNENSAFQATRNPWAADRVPGGSSGGSAVAVAARLVSATLGTDTGGSIRLPASFCGVVGVKPSYGRVSRYGLIAFASSLDQIGPLTKTVEDAALVMQVIAGVDPRDSTSSPAPSGDLLGALKSGVAGLRVGIPKEYLAMAIEAGVRGVFDQSATLLAAAGAQLVDVSLPSTEYALAAYYVIAPAEVSSNLARMDGVRFGPGFGTAANLMEAYERARHIGFGPEVRRRIALGTYVLSSGYYDAYYLRAQKVRTLVAKDFERVFKEVDCVISPTAPTTAFRMGERVADPLAMYATDLLTLPANLAGVSGISVPAGFADGLPVGLQVLGPYMGEATCFRVAAAVEEMAQVWQIRPGTKGVPEAAG